MSAFMSKTSMQSSRARRTAQAPVGDDALLSAWAETLARNRTRPAILDNSGRASRTFSQMEERARFFAHELERYEAGEVVAVQIGNHPDWPSLFLACLRRAVVVVPLERSISPQQRERAIQLCHISALAAAAGSGVNILPLRTAA